jgi:peptidoglycan/LPS O-acetylase OafA/YrhL
MRISNEKFHQRIAQLDGWRGVSILFVVIGHLVGWHCDPTYNPGVPSVANVLPGWGVDIFFVISGFIITKLALREYDSSGNFSIRNFYTRRVFRIVPPFYLYLASVILATSASLIVQRQSETLTAAVFGCNLPPGIRCGWFVGHSWSLAFEEQFYLSFPLLFTMVGRNSRKLIAMLFVALVSFPFLRIFHLSGRGWGVAADFVSSFSFICAGAVTASYEDYIKRLSESRGGIYLSYLSALVLAGLLFLNLRSNAVGSIFAYIQVSLNPIVLPISIAWLVASSVHQSNLFTKALTTPPLLFFGMISYSLYLWQQMFSGPPRMYISDSLIFSFPLMFLVATLSYYFVERPFVRFGKRLLSSSGTSSRQSQVASV